MKKIIILLLFFCNIGYSQFLDFYPSTGENSVGIYLQKYYFRYNYNNQMISEDEEIYFKKNVPSLIYGNNNFLFSLSYLNGKYNNLKTKLFSIDLSYKLLIPLYRIKIVDFGLPLIIRTNYFQILQEKKLNTIRFENGNFGIGSGIQFYKDFDNISYTLLYNFCINYSTINFSIDYGYSIQNEILFNIKFNEVIENLGVLVGCRYADQKWDITQKKYNYYCSQYGLLFGIIF